MMKHLTDEQALALKRRVGNRKVPNRIEPWVGRFSVEVMRISTARLNVARDDWPNLRVWLRKLGTASAIRFSLWTAWHSKKDKIRFKDKTRFLFRSVGVQIYTVEHWHKKLKPEKFDEYLENILIGKQLDGHFDMYRDSKSHRREDGSFADVYKSEIYVAAFRPLGYFGAKNTRFAKMGTSALQDAYFKRLAQEAAERERQMLADAEYPLAADPPIVEPPPALDDEKPEFEDDIE